MLFDNIKNKSIIIKRGEIGSICINNFFDTSFSINILIHTTTPSIGIFSPIGF